MEQSLKSRAVAAMQSLGKRKSRARIPDHVREAVMAYAAQARGVGRQWQAIAADVGVSTTMLMRWRQRLQRDGGGSGFVPVRVSTVASPSSSSLVLVTPAGHRVEGLSVAEAVELVRSLS